MLVITAELCNLLSYMRNLNILIDLSAMELADLFFFYKSQNIGAVPELKKKKSIKKIQAGVKNRGGQ